MNLTCLLVHRQVGVKLAKRSDEHAGASLNAHHLKESAGSLATEYARVR